MALLVLLMGVALFNDISVSSVEASLIIVQTARAGARILPRTHDRWRPLRRAAAGAAGAVSEADFTVSNIRVAGAAAHLRGHGLQLSAGQHRRSSDAAARARGACARSTPPASSATSSCAADGNALIVAVAERPSIESIDIKGNKDIKTEDLQKSLRNVGLSAGKTFDRSTLDEVTQYLTDQYYSRGKYAVKIDAKVENLPDNRVRVSIDIKEGSRAKIRQINIVGNTALQGQGHPRDPVAARRPNWQSWYKQSDRYSRETLQGDLEKIQTYYQDRGYANFHIDSVQVAIAPDKSDIFITVNVTEGAGLQARRDQAGRQSDRARGGAAAPAAGAARPDLLAEAASVPRRRPSRTGSAPRVSISPRSSRCRRCDETEQDRQPDAVRRSGQPRVRASHQFHRHHAQQR